MKTRIAATLVACAAMIFIAGCDRNPTGGDPGDSENPPGGVTTEQDAMKYYAAQDEFVMNDERTYSDDAVEPDEYEVDGSPKVAADITPLRFGRFITSVTKATTVTIQPGDTLAVAVVDKNIVGIFRIRAVNSSNDTVLVEKPFSDKSKRNVIFKRVNRGIRRFWLNWIPVATSLVDGGTVAPNNLIDIVRLDLILPGNDTITVTDPTNTYLRYRWRNLPLNGCRGEVPELIFGQQARLQATVVSTSADTDLVLLRLGFDSMHRKRLRLHIISETNNGDGTYTRTYAAAWIVHPHPGFFHAGVDAMTRATVFDDSAPYSVSWWGAPYRAVPGIR